MMKHNILRRLGALALCLVLALGLALPSFAARAGDTGDEGDTPVVITGIDIEESEITLLIAQTMTLNATTTPPGAAVVWSSSDESIAVVDENGVVIGISEGEATVTAEADGFTDTCRVTVREPIYVTSINLPLDEMQFKDSDNPERSISVEIYPSNADYNSIVFKSEDESIVTIENETSDTMDVRRYGRITAVSPGETYIVATLDGVEGQPSFNELRCRVTVSGITLSDKAGNAIGEGDRIELIMGTSENLTVSTFGDAKNISKIDWYSDNNNIVSVANGRLTPRSPGKAKVTAMRGNYSASFDVTVKEDTSRLVEVDDSVPAGMPYSFRDIREELDDVCREQTGKPLSYITSLSVQPSQGILYYGYISESDTGSGVGMTDRYYYSGRDTDDYLINGLTFVPRSSFSGNAEINYTAVASDNSNISGIIRVTVDAMEDVSYTTGSGQNVFFLGSDFNTVCRAQTGRELTAVTFTLPSSSRGTLYYNYTTGGQYTEKVEAGTRYRRTGNPNLDGVSFLPTDGFEGSVRISYRGEDTAGGTFSGYVTVTVTDRGTNGDADVRFTGRAGREISFTASRFNTACREATGESLDYVQFELPDRDDGTLYYNSGSSSERKVSENSRYYRSGSPSISSVSFVPAKNAPDQVRIKFSGRSVEGTNFTGTVLIDYTGNSSGTQTIRYSVYSGRAVQFEDSDFNSECVAATGSTLNYVRFELPSASRGLLCYDYSGSGSRVSSVNTSTRYYRGNSGSNRLDRVYFLADSRYTGSVSISYTGYSNDGESFEGTVSVQVNALAPAEVSFYGSGSQPISMSSSQIRNACNALLDDDLSYIQFTSLPSSSMGRLYRDYSGFDTGSQVVTGTQYYVSGSPGIDQLSFVPRGGFSGTATVTYTGVSTRGEQVSGRISFVVSGSGASGYFNDMGGYSWAVNAADYLHQNGVITGIGNGQFGPGQNIRRCDFVVMLCRAYNFNGGTSDFGFADVPADSYYASAVAAAKNLGIISGDGTNFRPNGQLTRQDAMVIIKNALQAAGWSLGGGSTAELSSFVDGGSVAPYAQESVATLVRLGAVNGDNNGNLRPWDPINRAEAAVILHYVMTM